jgi:tRNA(Ile2)-agmatinylcytidine synthase
MLHIGFDDTDSSKKGCTTYIASLIIEQFDELNIDFVDYPNLIRLNPNVPWKTRGNGALCLRINDDFQKDQVIEIVLETVEKHSDLECTRTDPGVLFYSGNEVPSKIRGFAKKAVHEIVSKQRASQLISRFKARAYWFKDGRGLIGALAAIGEVLPDDHTYELITYRIEKNRGKPRKVDKTSVLQMNEKTSNLTFNNIDPEKNRVLITPRGPDPILYGIRGENPEIVKKAHQLIKVNEDIESWVVFRTNQGTDAHLKRVSAINRVKHYQQIIVNGIVTTSPRTVPKRHVIFTISDDKDRIDCAAYEPTGKFRNMIRLLMKGDEIEAFGAIIPDSKKHRKTVNLEKIKIVKLAKKFSYHNPSCPKCRKKMESQGKNSGYRCKRCKHKTMLAKKIEIEEERGIKEKLYIPPPRANRHLTKPLQRYNIKKNFTIKPDIKITDFWSKGEIN